MMNDRLVEYAALQWQHQDGIDKPYSPRFDDIYFAKRGLEETYHVFLKGNDLPHRFEQSKNFTIGETGFGTGLNFLCAWHLWRQTKRKTQSSLQFFSFEKYPLHIDDLKKAHALWPEFKSLSKTIREQWPPNVKGIHHLNLEKGVTLTLCFDDIAAGFKNYLPHSRVVDAWFLDGFSPAKNPEIWSMSVFEYMAKISRNDCTLATFTVAGFVRRSLQAAGFEVEKAPGFGRKRHMLKGRLSPHICSQKSLPKQPANPTAQKPWLSTQTLKAAKANAKIAIIGGGIAGASLAFSLSQYGFQPVLFEERHIGAGASGNLAGLIMPRLDRDDNPAARFSLHAYLYTLRLIQYLQKDHPDIELFNPCGANRQSRYTSNQSEKYTKEINLFRSLQQDKFLPPDYLEFRENRLFFPQAGVISPPTFTKLLIGKTEIIQKKVISIEKDKTSLTLITEDQKYSFDTAILANGLRAKDFLCARGLPITGSLGQIDVYKDAPSPPDIKVYGPYMAPLPSSNKEVQSGIVVGANYNSLIDEHPPSAPSLKASQQNLSSLSPFKPEEIASLTPDTAHGRASIRCVTPDQLPIAGPLPDWSFFGGAYDGLRNGRVGPYPDAEYQNGLYALIGLGSRGLVTAPYASAMIASRIAGMPAPTTSDIFETVHPGRFFIRTLKRAQSLKNKG